MPSIFYYFNNTNYPILVTDKTRIITPHTFLPNNTLWENNSIYQFFSNIKNEEVNILDIGAQSGLYSLFSKFLPKTTFFSFEPFLETFNLLNDNLMLNNIKNVHTFNIGLSNIKETKILNTCLTHNGLHTLGQNLTRFNNNKKVSIEVDTIDNLFYDKNIPVHFIKIDTEGWELNILYGAEKTINKYRPIIQIEWVLLNMKQCNIDENDLILFFNIHNYFEKSHQDDEKLFCPI